MPRYRCLNCPGKPTFLDLDALKVHWEKTHTVPMEHTVAELGPIPELVRQMLGDALNKTIKLYDVVPDPVTS